MTMTSASKPLPIPPKAAEKQELDSNPTPNNKPTRTTINNNVKMEYEDDEEFEFFHEFSREKVKDVIHLITAELKDRGANVEYLMIPFRPQQTNEKLLKLLNSLFPLGNGQPVAEKQRAKIVKKAEPLTLFQGLKYIWCRLPEGQVIGWKAYLEFKLREKSKNFPKRGFLEIMPQCLTSPSHASIVYDFFDLIITLASNSRINKLSARKISKMCAIWAFGKPIDGKPLDYDFTDTSSLPSNSFQDGLDEWIPGTDAMFHLLLSFLKSFVPQDLESAQLPLALKSLLFNNDYPPEGSTAYSSETILTIPLVTLRTDKFSRKPWQLLERCNELLDFTNHDAFQAREDYALLKSLFKKKNNVEGISRKMSQESRRLMKLMSTKHSTFQAGWTPRKCLPNEANLKETIEVGRVEIDDYFIWAWLSTLSYEQTSEKKNIFGRSLILEFEFDGFKKWVLFQECDVTLDRKKRQRQLDVQPALPVAPVITPAEPPQKKIEIQRNITPAYDKFQNMVTPAETQSGDTSSSDMYHTVISKESLGRGSSKHNVNLHSIEQKISKWNPLHKVRKKSSAYGTTSSKEELPVVDSYQKKTDSTLLEHHKSIYQLPPIERDPDGFKDLFVNQEIDREAEEEEDIASLRAASPKLKRTPPPVDPSTALASAVENNKKSDEAMEELKGMVEQMMSEDKLNFEYNDSGSSTTINSTKETFESLTKFDQYRPSSQVDVDTPTSSSSAVPSLKLDEGVPSLKAIETKPMVQSGTAPVLAMGEQPGGSPPQSQRRIENHRPSELIIDAKVVSEDPTRYKRTDPSAISRDQRENYEQALPVAMLATGEDVRPLLVQDPPSNGTHGVPIKFDNFRPPEIKVNETSRVPPSGALTRTHENGYPPSARNEAEHHMGGQMYPTAHGMRSPEMRDRSDGLNSRVPRAIESHRPPEIRVNEEFRALPQEVPPNTFVDGYPDRGEHRMRAQPYPSSGQGMRSPEMRDRPDGINTRMPRAIETHRPPEIRVNEDFQALPRELPPNNYREGYPRGEVYSTRPQRLADNRIPKVEQQPITKIQHQYGPPAAMPISQTGGYVPNGPPSQHMRYEYGSHPAVPRSNSENPIKTARGRSPDTHHVPMDPYAPRNVGFPPPQAFRNDVGRCSPTRYQEYNRQRSPKLPHKPYMGGAPGMRSPQQQGRNHFHGQVDPSTMNYMPPSIPVGKAKRNSGGMPGGGVPMDFYAPEAPHGNKLHGGHINKQQERKKLHENIRNGNFGI